MPPGATGRPRSEARGEQTRTRGTPPLASILTVETTPESVAEEKRIRPADQRAQRATGVDFKRGTADASVGRQRNITRCGSERRYRLCRLLHLLWFLCLAQTKFGQSSAEAVDDQARASFSVPRLRDDCPLLGVKRISGTQRHRRRQRPLRGQCASGKLYPTDHPGRDGRGGRRRGGVPLAG